MTKKLVSNAYELNVLLEKKYGERLNTDSLRALMGQIQGTLDSKKITISYNGEYLLLSTSADSREVLDELLPLLTEVMRNEKPICSYDLQSEGLKENEAMPTIEWDLTNPENRIKEIVNDRAFSNKSKILNLKLYNGKNISDYLETEQEKEDRIKNTRIYGIDPGCLKDPEKIKNLNEVDLYLMIDSFGGHIWRLRHEMSHGRIEYFDLTEYQYALEFMVYQTKKFGVELEEPAIDKHITPTPSYNAWYKFYSNHFRYTLTDEEWNAFQNAQKNNEDVSQFMPEGNWKDLIEKPAQKTLK